MYQSQWEKHTNTEFHKTGILKKGRYKDPNINHDLKCDKCNLVTTHTMVLKKHILDVHSTKEERKKNFKYYCDVCDVGCFSKAIMNAHDCTKKHKKALQRNQITEQNIVVNK